MGGIRGFGASSLALAIGLGAAIGMGRLPLACAEGQHPWSAEKGSWSVSTIYEHYEHGDFMFHDPGTAFREEPVQENVWTVAIEHTPIPRLTVYGNWGYNTIGQDVNPGTDSFFQDGHNDDFRGMNDWLLGAKYQVVSERGAWPPVSVAPFVSIRHPTGGYGSDRYVAPGWSDPQYEMGLAVGRIVNPGRVPRLYVSLSSSVLVVDPSGEINVPEYGFFTLESGITPLPPLPGLTLRAFVNHMQAGDGIVSKNAADFINQLGGQTGPGLLAHVDTALKKQRTIYGLGCTYHLLERTVVGVSFTHELSDRYVRMTTEVKGLQLVVTQVF